MKTRILLCIALGLLLTAGTCHDCRTFQDIAAMRAGNGIDSIAVRFGDSLAGCRTSFANVAIGSKTHSARFPREAHVQLFENGVLLWEDFSFELPKNSEFVFRRDAQCEGNSFIDSSHAEIICWTIEEAYDGHRCMEDSMGSEEDFYFCAER